MGPILTDADPPMLGQLQAFGLLRRTGSHSRQDSIRLLLDCRLLTGDALHHSRLHLKPIV
ncbi:hypothetical protein ACCO45_000702 [Purpureocillium lilacinum]|uniref:Uncharacterized protein n=1 Tax=Purpureocillium lilacinum TaxID=33203 RepID=A0ACC4E854_PURLI